MRLKLIEIYIQNIKYKKNISYCATHCLYVFYIKQIMGFRNAVINLHY